MLLFLIKEEITENEDIALWSQKKWILNFCFAPKKNLKEDQINRKAKTKEKVCLQFLFSFRTISKQLTILGKISGQIEPYFGNPQVTYEQYVNKNWQLNHGKYGLEQDFLSAFLMEWERIKNDKKTVADYIVQDAPPAKQIRSGFIHHIPSTTSSAKGKQSNPLLVSTCSISCNSVPCQSPALNIPNIFVELLERESYLKFNKYQLVIQTLSEIGTKNSDNVLTDDGWRISLWCKPSHRLRTLGTTSIHWGQLMIFPQRKTESCY